MARGPWCGAAAWSRRSWPALPAPPYTPAAATKGHRTRGRPAVASPGSPCVPDRSADSGAAQSGGRGGLDSRAPQQYASPDQPGPVRGTGFAMEVDNALPAQTGGNGPVRAPHLLSPGSAETGPQHLLRRGSRRPRPGRSGRGRGRRQGAARARQVRQGTQVGAGDRLCHLPHHGACLPDGRYGRDVGLPTGLAGRRRGVPRLLRHSWRRRALPLQVLPGHQPADAHLQQRQWPLHQQRLQRQRLETGRLAPHRRDLVATGRDGVRRRPAGRQGAGSGEPAGVPGRTLPDRRSSLAPAAHQRLADRRRPHLRPASEPRPHRGARHGELRLHRPALGGIGGAAARDGP